MMFMSFHSNTTDITCGAGTANHSGTPELTPISSGVGVARSLVFYVLTVCFVDLLSFFSFFDLRLLITL